jgi:hypothetical protein
LTITGAAASELQSSATVATMSLTEADYTKLNWESTGGKLTDFDDGHVPELCRNPNSGSSSAPMPTRTRIVDYPDFYLRQPPQVRVYSKAFPEVLVDSMYQKTRDAEHPAWGNYVTIAQIKEFWENNDDSMANITDFDAILVQLVARYLELAMKPLDKAKEGHNKSLCTLIGDPGSATLFSELDLERAHGVAVWSLRSKAGSEVSGLGLMSSIGPPFSDSSK